LVTVRRWRLFLALLLQKRDRVDELGIAPGLAATQRLFAGDNVGRCLVDHRVSAGSQCRQDRRLPGARRAGDDYRRIAPVSFSRCDPVRPG
jgi:hypothetical protein